MHDFLAHPSRSLRVACGAAMLAIAVAACSTTTVAEPASAPLDQQQPSQPAGQQPAGDVPADPAPEPAASTDAVEAPAPAPQDDVAVTTNGVPVAIIGDAEDRRVVRSPCGNEVALAELLPIGAVEVVIDPGHGGPVDTGAVGANGLREADLNLRVGEAFLSELEARGISAIMTRTADYAVPIPVRVAFADATEAKMLVSIHHNAPMMAHSPHPGTEVFVQSDSHHSERLGGLFQEQIVSALSQFDINWVSARDAGVLRVEQPDGKETYGIIRLAETPTALVELGYMANPAEAAFFATDMYTNVAAKALADAAEDYLRSDRLEGFRAGVRTFTAGRSHASTRCVDPPLGN